MSPSAVRKAHEFVPTLDYITPRDYLRPMLGAFLFGAGVAAIVSCFGLVMGPGGSLLLFLFCLAVYTIQFPITFFISAVVHHQVYLHRLRKYGPEWFVRDHIVEMPQAEAFELCLAACGHIPRANIVAYDDNHGWIKLRVKGNFWVTVDRTVKISIERDNEAPEDKPRTRLCIDAKVRLTKFRTHLIKLVWGDKWYPIVFRTDRNLNSKLLDSITEFVHSVPNWDHRHISVSEDEHWNNLIGLDKANEDSSQQTNNLNTAA